MFAIGLQLKDDRLRVRPRVSGAFKVNNVPKLARLDKPIDLETDRGALGKRLVKLHLGGNRGIGITLHDVHQLAADDFPKLDLDGSGLATED